jgi:hypothetical protein
LESDGEQFLRIAKELLPGQKLDYQPQAVRAAQAEKEPMQPARNGAFAAFAGSMPEPEEPASQRAPGALLEKPKAKIGRPRKVVTVPTRDCPDPTFSVGEDEDASRCRTPKSGSF